MPGSGPRPPLERLCRPAMALGGRSHRLLEQVRRSEPAAEALDRLPGCLVVRPRRRRKARREMRRSAMPGWRLLLIAAVSAVGSMTLALAEPRHGLSAFGDLKYPPDFKHFDYVNPDAPKGGRLASISSGGLTFNHFNAFMLRGDS